MTPENFCYWLQGFIEIEKPKKVDPNQMKCIEDHLKLVFTKLTPNRANDSNQVKHISENIFLNWQGNESC